MTAYPPVVKSPRKSSLLLFKITLSVFFLFLIYLIFSTNAEISQRLKTISVNALDIHDLQVSFLEEVREWKNLLLRSHDKESTASNWKHFTEKHHAVNEAANKIIAENNEARVTDPIKIFLYYHKQNLDKYDAGKERFLKSGFNPQEADAAVEGIDRNLIDELENAGIAMEEEQAKLNERVAGVSNNRIEQFLVLLAFMGLLIIWMPKW